MATVQQNPNAIRRKALFMEFAVTLIRTRSREIGAPLLRSLCIARIAAM
jgi:hypothetical protein